MLVNSVVQDILQKVYGCSANQESICLYWTQKFITVFIKASCWTLSLAI